jgi:acetyl-CoA synthetase
MVISVPLSGRSRNNVFRLIPSEEHKYTRRTIRGPPRGGLKSIPTVGTSMGEGVVWRPTGYYAEESNIQQFQEEFGYDDYQDLITESMDHLAEIWGDIETDSGIVWRSQYDEVVDVNDGMEFAHWFPGGRLNAAETCLDQWVDRSPDRVMYEWTDEQGNTEAFSYDEMAALTNTLANAMKNHGVSKSDVVGVMTPLHPIGFAVCLACLRIGAVFTQIFPGYGAEAIGHRLTDSNASIVFAADGYRRNGTDVDLLSKVDRAIDGAPTVDDLVIFDHLGVDAEVSGAEVHDSEDFVAGFDPECETEIVDSDHPAFIAYSSGTTGTPKGTIQTHASLLAMGNKECRYHFDCGEGDTMAWVTDFGWIIVPIWMLGGAPALGTTTLLLEGGPSSPTGDRVWNAIENYGVTTFGISPSGARGLRQQNAEPREDHDLSSLRILGSTGEPWDVDGWNWLFSAVGDRALPMINASGGTELAGALLSPTPATPLKPATLYGPAPGVGANIYDEEGQPADDGYLVVEYPIPGMTHSLTDGDERYLAEYWETFPGVWNQNDWAERDADGFWFITGRADDTMNVAGRRVTAPEIEEVIAGHPAVNEATVIAVPHDRKGEVPVAFVTLKEGDGIDPDSLEKDIRAHVADRLGAPFRPEHVYVVPSLPRTQTGKIPRTVIEAVYFGDPVGNLSTLDGGDVLADYPTQDADE